MLAVPCWVKKKYQLLNNSNFLGGRLTSYTLINCRYRKEMNIK